MAATFLLQIASRGSSFRWDQTLLWWNAVADAVTALAYFAIPLTLLGIFRARRPGASANAVLVAFSIFIFACGATYLIEEWNLWHSDYWLEASARGITAVLALVTAIYLARRQTQLVTMPSPRQLVEHNAELEMRVAERTRELAEVNAALRQKEARLELVVRGNNEGIWEWNVTNGEFQLSEKIYEILRLPPTAGTISREGVRALFRLTNPAIFREALRRHDEEGERFGFEAQFIRADGSLVWLRVRGASQRNAEGKITHMAGSLHDVDEERRTADTLAFQGRVLSQISDVVVALDFERRITFLNRAGERLYGVSASEVTGGPVSDVYTVAWKQPDDQAHAIERLETTGRWSGNVYHILRSGRRIPVESSVNYLTDASERRTGMLAVVRNISMQLELEEQVRVAQKMEAVGLLAGGVAHDFNNLLQVITGYTALALDEDATWPERKSHLELVRGAADRAGQLTRQLLAFGRRQKLQTVDLDLNRAIEDLLKMITRVIGVQVAVSFSPGKALGNVRVDRAQIDQVLLNLCLNARDAMPEGGKLTLSTENVLVNSSFRETHPWAKPGRYVLVTVTDNGVGMDHETRGRIFEPFFTTKPLERGTGLGLAVVYGVIKQHDGMVHVYSEEGTGTTFQIYLPIVERQEAPNVSPPPVTAAARGTETILLAEDEMLVRELALKILERAGYRVYAASDGVEACELFEKHGNEISLLLFDVVMPRLGGREACEKIIEKAPALRVIYCSGYTGEAFLTTTLKGSRAHLLAKPYNADELLSRVRSVLDAR